MSAQFPDREIPTASPSFTNLSGSRIDQFERIFSTLSPERQEIFFKLQDRKWFQQTDEKIQIELAQLPEDPDRTFNGFLADLAQRPDKIANITALRLLALPHGNSAIIPVFEVRNDQGVVYSYEYVSWRYGPHSGAKGLVLLEQHGKPTHFAILSGEKFATGQKEADALGGFLDLNIEGVRTVVDRIRLEIAQELGQQDLKLARDPVILGDLAIDPGMTNNRPTLFLASIDLFEAQPLSKAPQNLDQLELTSHILVFPLEQIWEVVTTFHNSYFQASVIQAYAQGYLDIPPPQKRVSANH